MNISMHVCHRARLQSVFMHVAVVICFVLLAELIVRAVLIRRGCGESDNYVL